MLLFIISTVDINYAQHMKFNGISMGETPTVFIKVGSINSIFYFLHKTAEPFNCLEQDNLA